MRQPERPEELRQSTFEDEFDYTTLVYDLFIDVDGVMRMLCPPPDEFFQHLQETQFRDVESGEILDYTIEVVDRVSYLKFARCVSAIEGSHAYGRVTLSNQPNLSQVFADRNVVFTMQKNNRLNWLTDWAQYYVKHHNANGFLIYDNASDDYDLTDVYHAINQVAEGLEVMVIDWPFKYGPAPTKIGDFQAVWSQRVALNHARLRFLGKTAGSLNIDIDEYVWCVDGGSIFSRFQNSGKDFIKISGFKGLMAKQFDNDSIRNINHLGARDKKKWICNGAMTRQSYWQPHTVRSSDEESGEMPLLQATFELDEAVYFHLRGLRTVATNRKARDPKQEVRREKRKPAKNGSSFVHGLKVALLNLRNFYRSKNKASISVDMIMDPDLIYAERSQIEPVFEQFSRAVRDLPIPKLVNASSLNPLHKRIWAGELFRRQELRAARARVQELVETDGNRKSYARFLKLINEEMRGKSSK